MEWVKIAMLLIGCSHGIYGVAIMADCPSFDRTSATLDKHWCKNDSTVTYTVAKQNCEDICSVLAVPTNGTVESFHELTDGIQRWVGIENNGSAWSGMDPDYNQWPGGVEPASNGQCQAATFTYSMASVNFSAHSCEDTFPYQCQQAVAPCGASPNIAQATKAYSQCSDTCCFIGGHVNYTCPSGYQLSGFGGTIYCNAGGNYDVDASNGSCEVVQCPVLNVTQATASSAVRNYGTSVTLTCNGGWRFNSLSSTTMTVTCQADGTWSPTVPASCDQFTCPAVQNVTFASYNTSSTAYDTVVGYTCDSGYMFSDGSVTRSTRCNELGVWTVTGIPACVALTCPQLTPIANGVINSTGLTYQSVATYVCDKGFMMPDGSKTGNQTCEMSATWTPTLSPMGCQVINCTMPPPVGVFANYSEPLDENQTSWIYGTKITYNCTNGYVFSTGDTQRFSRCTAQGDWLPPDIVCASEPIKVEKRTTRYPPKEAPGATITGSVGVIVLVSVVVSIVASDIRTLKRHLSWAKANIQSRSRKARPEEKTGV